MKTRGCGEAPAPTKRKREDVTFDDQMSKDLATAVCSSDYSRASLALALVATKEGGFVTADPNWVGFLICTKMNSGLGLHGMTLRMWCLRDKKMRKKKTQWFIITDMWMTFTMHVSVRRARNEHLVSRNDKNHGESSTENLSRHSGQYARMFLCFRLPLCKQLFAVKLRYSL